MFAVGIEQGMKHPGHRHQSCLFTGTSSIHGNHGRLHILHQLVVDAHSVTEQLIGQIHIRSQSHRLRGRTQTIQGHLNGIDQPKEATATHQVLVEYKLFTLTEFFLRLGDDHRLIVVQNVGIVGETAPIDLIMVREGLADVVHIQHVQFAVPFQKGHGRHLIGQQAPHHIAQLIFQGLHGAVQILGARTPRQIVEQVYRQFIVVDIKQRVRIDIGLDAPPIGLGLKDRHGSQLVLGQFFLRRWRIGRIYKLIAQSGSRSQAKFVEHIACGPRQLTETRIQVARQIHLDQHLFVVLP